MHWPGSRKIHVHAPETPVVLPIQQSPTCKLRRDTKMLHASQSFAHTWSSGLWSLLYSTMISRDIRHNCRREYHIEPCICMSNLTLWFAPLFWLHKHIKLLFSKKVWTEVTTGLILLIYTSIYILHSHDSYTGLISEIRYCGCICVPWTKNTFSKLISTVGTIPVVIY